MRKPCIAVTGLHRGENPQPGAAIIQSLRRVYPGALLIGLVYDIQESGIYASDGPDHVQLMPYPSAGLPAFLERLDAIHSFLPIDVLIPSLDAELELLVHLGGQLAVRGIQASLPSREALRRRSKALLPELVRTCRLSVPETRVAHDLSMVRTAVKELGFPLMVKGSYYEARRVTTLVQAQHTAAGFFSQWGSPVILQRCVEGSEFNVLGLGDGQGSIIGMCCIRKTSLSDAGKGLGGIVVEDEHLADVTRRLIRSLRWNGPFEAELIRETESGLVQLIEVNPRFPAWVGFPSQIGANFPAALVERLLGEIPVTSLAPCKPGAFFLRHQIEVVGDVSRYAELLGHNLPARAAHRLSAPSIS